MKMSQYPAAIAQAAQVVNELDSQIAAVTQHIARLEGNADRVAAFEQGLKNEDQRRGVVLNCSALTRNTKRRRIL
jgi:prefoldin subunit 5